MGGTWRVGFGAGPRLFEQAGRDEGRGGVRSGWWVRKVQEPEKGPVRWDLGAGPGLLEGSGSDPDLLPYPGPQTPQ